MSNFNILIIEDDPLWRIEIAQILIDTDKNYMIHISRGLDEADIFLQTQTPDLIIADIMYDDDTIFDFLDRNPIYRKLKFIFITVSESILLFNKSKYVLDSLYLVKPFHKHTLISAINTFVSDNDKEEQNSKHAIIVRGKYMEKILLEPKYIIYIQAALSYCKIYTLNSRFNRKFSIVNIASKFGEEFIRIHRGYLVNKNHILLIDLSRMFIHTPLGKLPIGRNYKKTVEAYLSKTRKI